MPLSNLQHLPIVMHYVMGLTPRAVLDVGIGMGTFGWMTRQFCDVTYERLSPRDWQLTIKGIEVCESYRNPVWTYAYNSVEMGDALGLVPRERGYDVVLLNDILEHFNYEQAIELLDTSLEAGSVVIATTPNTVYPQGAWGGNEAETHRCTLHNKDFPDAAARHKTGCTTCYVCTRDPLQWQRVKNLSISCPAYTAPALTGLVRRARRKLLSGIRLGEGRGNGRVG